ncbi:MAG TPA: alpha/beta fold hydrolase [Burkholderiales bacterium]|nr:alpha/beta fold hydrolase [Burkholderiales bacterium]
MTDATIIWLHGLGADHTDFEPIVPELDLPPSVRFVFPDAPVRPVTINGGMRMRAWYDILQFGPGPEDAAGIRESQKIVEGLIEQAKVPAERVVLAGFSQGGAIVLHTALRYPRRLAGVVALSTYVPLQKDLERETSAENRGIPVFMAHGRFDDIIPLARAAASRELLAGMGYKVDWREYAMPHSVCMEEIGHISAFLKGIL